MSREVIANKTQEFLQDIFQDLVKQHPVENIAFWTEVITYASAQVQGIIAPEILRMDAAKEEESPAIIVEE